MFARTRSPWTSQPCKAPRRGEAIAAAELTRISALFQGVLPDGLACTLRDATSGRHSTSSRFGNH